MRSFAATVLTFCAFATLVAQERNVGMEAIVEEYRFGSFLSAEAISTDQFGNVFVADAGAMVIHKFDIRGKQLAEVGGPGWGSQQFDRPTGIDARLGIAVYVADMGNNRISRFDRDLNFMATLDGDDGSIDPGFGYPVDVAQSALEQMFILDSENNRILALRGFGHVERVFGGIDAGPGRLRDPVALATGTEERLYVLESGRVVMFDYFGNFLGYFGNDLFTDAQGLTVTPRGILVVTPDTLYLFAAEGDHLRTIPRSSLVFASDAGEFRDAIYTRIFLLILTTHSCILFPTNSFF